LFWSSFLTSCCVIEYLHLGVYDGLFQDADCEQYFTSVEQRMERRLQQWLTQDGVRLFIELGLCTGDRVLDFGCGDGVYSIPAARVVGNEGVVYGLDQNKKSLNSLMEKAANSGLYNIVAVHDLHELYVLLYGLPLDVVLLYDVIHSYYFTNNERVGLLRSVCGMVKSNGLISIFPRHMDNDEILNLTHTLNQLECFLERRQSTNLMHDGMYTFDATLNFRKIPR